VTGRVGAARHLLERAGLRLARGTPLDVDLRAARDVVDERERRPGRQRLLLRRLDIVGMPIAQAADVLSDAAVMRSR
jgi:hypothetical protein